jgi:undecaprenyl diphosphate synthase
VGNSQTLQHVGIIMDGNGRWAQKRGMPRLYGHRKGVDALKRAADAAIAQKIPFMTVWAFSTENWNRPQDEISGILNLLEEYLSKDVQELHQKGIKLRVIGDILKFPLKLQKAIEKSVVETEDNKSLTLIIALNYGGRQELTFAMQKIAQEVADGKLQPQDIQDTIIRQHIFAPDIPDPDMIIRTSGEYRLSGFLMWGGVYAELVFSPTLWPDFSAADLESAIETYKQRDRRYGKLSTKIA